MKKTEKKVYLDINGVELFLSALGIGISFFGAYVINQIPDRTVEGWMLVGLGIVSNVVAYVSVYEKTRNV